MTAADYRGGGDLPILDEGVEMCDGSTSGLVAFVSIIMARLLLQG